MNRNSIPNLTQSETNRETFEIELANRPTDPMERRSDRRRWNSLAESQNVLPTYHVPRT